MTQEELTARAQEVAAAEIRKAQQHDALLARLGMTEAEYQETVKPIQEREAEAERRKKAAEKTLKTKAAEAIAARQAKQQQSQKKALYGKLTGTKPKVIFGGK